MAKRNKEWSIDTEMYWSHGRNRFQFVVTMPNLQPRVIRAGDRKFGADKLDEMAKISGLQKETVYMLEDLILCARKLNDHYEQMYIPAMRREIPRLEEKYVKSILKRVGKILRLGIKKDQDFMAQLKLWKGQPDYAFIYFLMDGRDVVYIGQAKNLKSRLAGHNDKKYTSVKYCMVYATDADIIERYLIKSYDPPLNVSKGNASTAGDCPVFDLGYKIDELLLSDTLSEIGSHI